MMIRIAAITPEDFASRIMAHEGTEGNLKIIPYYYKNPMQTNELVKQVEECDVLLFAGPLPLFFAQQQIAEKRWPVVYIPSDEYTLTLTLAHILVHRKEGLQRLSIDIPKAEYVRQAANELQLDVSQWSIKDYGKIIDGHGNTFNADEIIRFHLNNWRTGQAQLVLTSVDYVYEQLTLASVPCISMIVPEKSIRETVLQASHYGQLMISKNAQIAVGLAAVNQSEDRLESMAPDARIMLQQMLLELGT
ncbi:MAG: transcriptional regulator, partial [Clostridia bacterium]